MDTEVYKYRRTASNSHQLLRAKFVAAGKRTAKKSGLNGYTYVYVAQIAMGADMNQTIKAISEAEKYKGPSLIIAYSPCINHGIKTGMGTSIMEERKAVESGYWHLYRYNPDLKKEGKNPFILDSKEPKGNLMDFIKGEIRYSQLENSFKKDAQELYDAAEKNAKERYETYKRLAQS